MNKIQTSFVCRLALLVVCLSHALGNDTNLEDVGTSLDANDSKEESDLATMTQTNRRSRMYRRGHHGGDDDLNYHDDHHEKEMDNDDQGDMKAMTQPKVDYWGGYYDFLINEGSYKFWAVFQLATAALLIYSGFAALYYAKINPPTTDEFDDILRRRRKRRSLSIAPWDKPFSGLDSATFQRIVDAIQRGVH